MDAFNLFQNAFYSAKMARNDCQYDQAIFHINNALEFYREVCTSRYYDPYRHLWSQILFVRAGIFMRMHHYKDASQDIIRALAVCPQTVQDPDEANFWLHNAPVDNLDVSLYCYDVALHFSAGNNCLQSSIHGRRALAFNELGKLQECDNEIKKCTMCDPQTALEQGVDWKNTGIYLVHEEEYRGSIRFLELAEKILNLLGSHRHDCHDCFNYIVFAAWNSKQYSKALEAGKKCYELKPVKDKNEAHCWKLKGNEILKEDKYEFAVECYSLAIGYAPLDDVKCLGILHSNRSSAYFREKKFKNAKEDAESCLKYRPEWSKGYYRLGSALLEMHHHNHAVNVLKNGLNIHQTPDEKYQIFYKIMEVVFCSKDGPKKIYFPLPRECMDKYLKECTTREEWVKLELLFLGGGGQQRYVEGESGLATGCYVSEISLVDLIKSKKKGTTFQKLLTVLIDHGACVNGTGKQSPLSVAVDEKDYESAVVLLKKKADVNGLLQSKCSKADDTPAHTAFRIGLSSGSWEIFISLMDNCENFTDNPDCIPEVVDKKGNTLFHLIAVGERMSIHTVTGIDLLKNYNFDPTRRNKNHQTPLDILSRRKDKRYHLIEEIVKNRSFQSHTSKKRKKKKKKKKKDSHLETTHEENSFTTPQEKPLIGSQKSVQREKGEDEKPKHEKVQKVHPMNEVEKLRHEIDTAINNIGIEVDTLEKSEKSASTSCNPANKEDEKRPVTTTDPIDTCSSGTPLQDKKPLPSNYIHGQDLPDDEDDFDPNCDVMFDNLTWEVECTSEVCKVLKDKRLSPVMKKRIIKMIQELANGNMRGHLAKPLEGLAKQNNIRLYEAKLTRGARILWELAIAFSPRCSNNPELLDERNEERKGEIYSDIIRVWDIVFDHDTVPGKIEKIVRSHRRGSDCIIKKQLKGFKVQPKSPSTNKDCLISIPNLYQHKDDSEEQPKREILQRDADSDRPTQFFPPGSPKETEYHILKFYAFSNSLVNAVLDDRRENNVDFPFRVSELEQAVINLKPKPMSSLLLLGRSGTGKTICCLYRLWFNFQSYWQRHTCIMEQPGIPKLAEFIPKEREENTTDGDKDGDKDGGKTKRDVQDTSECQSSVPRKSIDHKSAGLCSQTTCDENVENTEKQLTYEQLHQAFITKNGVLCTEVQRNFLDLSQACLATVSRSKYKRSSTVNKFNQLEEQAWPLFICSRDWLLMLDASLPEPAFFPRNDDGQLVRNVKGWGEEDNHLQEIPEGTLEDDDDDDDEENEDGRGKIEKEKDDSRPLRAMDPRLEVTYQVFKNGVWPKMTKKRKVHYHPTLVWTEIRSFIKGSVEALHSRDGYITLEEYQFLGRKRAPTFSADRETIYNLFLAYQRIKRNMRMFDEADLVHNIHRRLQDYVPEWSIHEIYVDETQDFTQAELSVIIRCCRDPNRLFFTGDTAQSIMRGIAFRFNDLKSLFYYMKESHKAVGQQNQVRVPDRVYQLTHNYRSHAGILNLASSVIDLLLHFFPESFDRMERDQGLSNGPKPVLLDSCRFTDLALILRGHKRKTSPIEFGAHQVVLVPSEEVRDSLPEELKGALVMTIYEAKGLEFDDVLLYNFFKESQARKEWRVVGSYTDQNGANVVSETAGIAEMLEDDLQTKTRPLEFDADRHNILISEFKFLYTALTRARVHVWLFDEDEEARAPMFEYFIKRRLVEVKRPQKTGDDKVSLEGMFAEKSSKEEWGKQGHFLYGKRLWKVACQCFTVAEDELMKMKCHAQMQAVKAASLRNEPRKLRMEFLKAGQLFLHCGMKDEAAICLHNARAWLLLAKLHQKCGYFLKAARLFRKEKKFMEASENFEKCLDFMRALDCLLKGQSYNQALEVIARCRKLEKRKVVMVSVPRVDQREESICYQAAEYYLKHRQLDLMTSALEKLPKTKDRITFLQKNACYGQAAELLLKEGKPQEAAELMRSNGKFLEATSFTDDDKFAADCYLLATRSSILSKEITVNTMNNGETQKLIEAPLHHAAELYERCGDVNGQAEVKFTRGKFLSCISDLEEAGKLYYRAVNYVGAAKCFLLLIDLEKDPKKFSCPIALDTIKALLYLILALHKKKQDNKDRTAILMCETYFGLVETGDIHARKIPQLEMARLTALRMNEEVKNKEIIAVEDAYNVIKEYLYGMASNLIQQVWNRQQNMNEQHKQCSRYLAGDLCDNDNCKCYHGDPTRLHFDDRFYALCFLINLNTVVINFLEELKKESAKVANQLRKRLSKLLMFEACQWLMDLLFHRSNQLEQPYFLEEKDLIFLRKQQPICYRIIEYARFLWCKAKEEDRWSDSDLFITVSNLMHVAAAPVADIFDLLCVEERKFERYAAKENIRNYYGFFPDRIKHGRYKIFSKWLEHSKSALHNQGGDVLKATQSAIKTFLYVPAKRSPKIPHPSIANAVMILEYFMTACLMLYSRLMINRTPVCLPKSYLSLTTFWDMVNMFKPNQSSLRGAIQSHAPSSFVEEGTLKRLQGLTESMVLLMFGGISPRYNIFSDALCDRTIQWSEAERALVLALTMLCNCNRGIPQSCETLIREEFLKFRSHDHLPSKLRQCIEAVQQSQGVFDVVVALQHLLCEKPRQEKLLDVCWDEAKSMEFARDCQLEFYSRKFHFYIDVNRISEEQESNRHLKEFDDVETRDEIVDDFPETFGESKDNYQGLEDQEDEKEREKVCLVIQRAFRNWMSRKASLDVRQKKVKNDPVEHHFQKFKLDKFACTICGNIQFEDHSLELSEDKDVAAPSSSSHKVEKTTSNWRPQILKRNTFNSHCSRKSPHWKKEKQFEKFKEFYQSEIYPVLEKAQQLYDEMDTLKRKTEIKCSLDLDRLDVARSRLQTTLKKVESACTWDTVKLIHDAAKEIIEAMKQLETIRNNQESLKADFKKRDVKIAANFTNNFRESEDSGPDDDGNDSDGVTHLNDVNIGTRKRPNEKGDNMTQIPSKTNE